MREKLAYIMLLVFVAIMPLGCYSAQGRIRQKTAKYTLPIGAREFPPVVVKQKSPPKKQQKISSLAEEITKKVSSAVAEGGEVWGFRVQVFSTFEKAEAEKFAKRLRNKIEEKVYIEFDPPYYKVRVGNFVNNEDAMALKKKLRYLGYSDAMIVRSRIEKESQ